MPGENIGFEQFNNMTEKAREFDLYKKSVEGMKRKLNPRAPNYSREIRRLDELVVRKRIEIFGH